MKRRWTGFLAAAADADLYEIRPEVLYTSADLNWMDKSSRSSVEMKDKSSRPELADKDADIAAYDRIFLGFPIWWYTAPAIIKRSLRVMISPVRRSFCLRLPEEAGLARRRKIWKDAVREQ